jgi:tRNA(Arg) A34 adenosine deaminase TadA
MTRRCCVVLSTVAKRARDAGRRPFGAVLADSEGKVLMEQGSGFASEGGDHTGHAQRLLASRAARHHSASFLAKCTLYTATEPCAMCAGAIYWAGIGRVVYGQTEKGVKESEQSPTLSLRCDIVFSRGTAPDRGYRPAPRERSSSASGGFLESTGRALLVRLDDLRSMIMAAIEVRKVEEQLNHRLLFRSA